MYDRNRDVALGNLADITGEGFSVMARESLEEDDVHEIRMKLPSEMEGPAELDVRARVKWSRPGAAEGYSKIGFQFVDPTDAQREIIGRLIEEFSYEDPSGEDAPFYPQELPGEET